MSSVQGTVAVALVVTVVGTAAAITLLSRPARHGAATRPPAQTAVAGTTSRAAWACRTLAAQEPASYEQRFASAAACRAAVAPYVDRAVPVCSSSSAVHSPAYDDCILAYTRPARAP